MPSPPIYDTFYRNKCLLLRVRTQATLKADVIAKLRDCFANKRPRPPYVFAKTYQGGEKLLLGASAILTRTKGQTWDVNMAWALVKTEPPFPHAPFDAFLRTLSPILQEKQSEVRASFGYDARHAASIFKRISLPDGAGVIDELIGFVGIKKSPEGKVMYKMEIVIGEKKLFHEISLSLPVTLGETLPTSLVEQLSKISLLGLMQKEGK